MSCFLQSPAMNEERQTLRTPRLIVFVLFVVKTEIFLSVANKELVLLLISLISEREFLKRLVSPRDHLTLAPCFTCQSCSGPHNKKFDQKVTIGNPTDNGAMGRVTDWSIVLYRVWFQFHQKSATKTNKTKCYLYKCTCLSKNWIQFTSQRHE